MALADVRVRGARAISEAVDRVYGATIRLEAVDCGRFRPRDNDDTEVRAKFWIIVQRVANLVQIVSLPVAIAMGVNPPQLTAGPAAPPAASAPTVPAPSPHTVSITPAPLPTGPR
jgi:hypothetical protein